MSKINDLKISKIAKVINNHAAFGDDFLSSEEALHIIDEIVFEETLEGLKLIDEDDNEQFKSLDADVEAISCPEEGQEFGDSKTHIDVV